jgi:hypothetical protein
MDMKEQVDYDAMLRQLQQINKALRKTNDELKRRCDEIEAGFTPLQVMYNRYVNQKLIAGVRSWVDKARAIAGLKSSGGQG